MKLALLGADDEALALVRTALDTGRHELMWAGELRDRQRVAARLPEALAVERTDSDLLAGSIADVVIVSATGDVTRRVDQLRALVQAGVAACVTNCVALGPIACYELDMNRAETQAALVPCLPNRRHPAIARVADWARDAGVSQVAFERGVGDTRAANVVQSVARDVDVVRAIFGDITRISAAGVPQGAASPERDFAGLNVYLTTHSGLTVRWAVDRQLHVGDGRITLEAGRGRAVLAMNGESWTLSVSPADAPASDRDAAAVDERFDAWRPAEAMLANIEAAAVGADISPTWLDAARAADVADMIETSLRRGRTIDIHNETYSEQGTFKGLMGIAGCGLLLLAFFTLLAAAIGQKTARLLGFDRLAVVFGYWHYALLVILIVFLLLQLLRYVMPPSPNDNREA